MGQHKTNPNAIAHDNGELHYKEKPKKMTRRELDRLMAMVIYSALGTKFTAKRGNDYEID